MIYQLYQARADLLQPIRLFAKVGAGLARQLDIGCYTPPLIRHVGAACELVATTALTHHRPPFGIDQVRIDGRVIGVAEHAVMTTPFGTLLHFQKEIARPQPRVLLVAPMSGHFSTLLRATVRTMLPEHDVFITDWHNARDIPVSAGSFTLDAYTDHVIRFLRTIGPGGHVVAVCQPAVSALVAVAVMAASADPAQPRSMTLMAGPIDTRINPTRVNELAKSQPIEWFDRNLIGTVPWRYRGAGRRVYPGFVQLSAFMTMNLDRHIAAHMTHFRSLVGGDVERAATHRRFYDEYNAVMDLPAEFYLDTVLRVFQQHDLPLGRFTWHGEPVHPSAIQHTTILTVEGEKDDICAVGQTLAALDLCTGVRPSMKHHHLQTGVGHYGVFSGQRWVKEVYPRVREMIQTTT